jgi:hypothetical protein
VHGEPNMRGWLRQARQSNTMKFPATAR